MRELVGWLITGIDPATGRRETRWSPCWFMLLAVRYAVFVAGLPVLSYLWLVLGGG